MKPVRIDFATPSLRRDLGAARPLHWAALALGLVLCAGAGLGLARLREGQAAQAVRQSRQEATSRVAAPASAPVQAIGAAQARAVNAAVQQLNLPWRDLREAIESTTPPSVALLALEPDPRTRALRITAEARTSADMLSYIEQLKRVPLFADVTLSRHDISETDPNRPLRFQLDAVWRATGSAP